MSAIGAAESNLNNIQANEGSVEELEDLDDADPFVQKNLTEGERMLNAFERKYLRNVIKKRRVLERRKRQKNVSYFIQKKST